MRWCWWQRGGEGGWLTVSMVCGGGGGGGVCPPLSLAGLPPAAACVARAGVQSRAVGGK